jgi:hypothetical protein
MIGLDFSRKWDHCAAMRHPLQTSKAVSQARVLSFVRSAIDDDLHAKRVLSLANGTLGVLHGASLAVATMGRALAQAQGLDAKHAIKQVDRLLSNSGIDIADIFEKWVPYMVGGRSDIVVALDWTEFDDDDQSTLALHLVTSHGRATPLLWKSTVKSQLKGKRNAIEDELVAQLRAIAPTGLNITILADRGFGDAVFYGYQRELGMSHVIRFRGNITVTDSNGESKPAKDWLLPGGRARILRHVTVTAQQLPVDAFVCVWTKGMKEPWFLACGGPVATQTAAKLVKLYAKRFSIEENFRDVKDIRFGMGLSSARVKSPERRDRLLLLSAFAVVLLTLLGAAAEQLGFDRLLRANTAKKRTHSLFNQGCYFYGAIPNMKVEKLRPLMKKFGELLQGQPVFADIFGII